MFKFHIRHVCNYITLIDVCLFRATSDKPDSKTLPWLQVNPSSKMDTSARLKPKSMKDFFILINGRGDDFSESEEKSYDFLSGFPK